jgi:transcriptional regulator of arginine metabolism
MKPRRQQAVRKLVLTRTIHSQLELQTLLRSEGFVVTQATLSRDLAELGVLKGPDGYRLPGADTGVTSPSRLESALRRELLSITAGGTTVVLRTPSGHGNALAVELDSARLPGALGTIAGDDTIFLAATGPAAARRLASQFSRLAGIQTNANGRAPRRAPE